jgi:hypothetical protein
MDGSVLAEQAPGTAERLSARHTLARAYRILGRHALPFGIIALVLAIVDDGCIYLAGRLVGEEPPASLAMWVDYGGGFVGFLLTWVMSVVVGVTWLRIILLDERHHPRAYLRFGARELRYLGVDIVLYVVVFVPLFVIAGGAGYAAFMSSGDVDWIDAHVYPLTAGVIVWGSVCAAWLGLAYPAVATDAAVNSLSLSLRLSRGHRLPLFVAYLLGTGSWHAFAFVLLMVAPEEMEAVETAAAAGGNAGLSQPIEFVASLLTYWAGLCFIAVSAAAYGQFRERSMASMARAFD